jgi:hypothetical protein
VLRVLPVALICLFLWPTTSVAQTPAPSLEISAGSFSFEDNVSEAFVGGGARFYARPRVSLNPDFTYIFGDDHSHLMLTGNLLFDFRRSEANQWRKLIPFGLIGGGLTHTRGRSFSGTNAGFILGAGLRTGISRWVTLGGDLRLGVNELYLRLGATIGVRFGQ